MADAPAVHIGENSPEGVAYKLMLSLAQADANTRKEALELYAECLDAVRGIRTVKGTASTWPPAR